MTKSSAFLLSEAESSDPNTSLSDEFVSNNFDYLTTDSMPLMVDDANSLYLTQPTFGETELASNDFCPISTSLASSRAKARKRAAVDSQCLPGTSSADTGTSTPTLELPTPEDIEELLRTQNPTQKKWCSKSVFPGFGNIPVCHTRKTILRGYFWNADLPPALRSSDFLSSLSDVEGRIRKHIPILRNLYLFSLGDIIS